MKGDSFNRLEAWFEEHWVQVLVGEAAIFLVLVVIAVILGGAEEKCPRW